MNALMLADQSGNEKEHTIDMIDRRAALAAFPIIDPGGIVGKSVASTIVLAESTDVVAVIDTLNSIVASGVQPDASKPLGRGIFPTLP